MWLGLARCIFKFLSVYETSNIFSAFGMLTEQRKFFGIQDRESLKCSKR
jgi:hypothetical protein